MPAIIDQTVCNCAPRCFAIPACPNDAIAFRTESGKVTIDSALCGDCPGPCTNFCDPLAIKFTPNPADFDLLEAQVLGTMTTEQIAAERLRRKEEAVKAAEAEKGQFIVELTARNFEQIVRTAELPIVIDVWADWCGPCKQFAPIFERYAQQYRDYMIFGKLNSDAEQMLSQQLGVQSLPTLLFIYRGQLVDRVIGALPAAQFEARLYQVLVAIQQQLGGPPPPPRPGSQPAGRGSQPPAGGPPPPSAGPGGAPPAGGRPGKSSLILP